jgi:hypothetical protein
VAWAAAAMSGCVPASLDHRSASARSSRPVVAVGSSASTVANARSGQFAQLVGNTAPIMVIGVSQPAGRFRVGGKIVVAQVGVGTELAPCRLPKRFNSLFLTRLRGRRRIRVDEARVERTLADDGERAVWSRATIEAGRITIVTDSANLAHEKQQAILFAIDADLVDHLLVTRCLAFAPECVAAAAPVVRPAGFEREAKRVLVHVGQHQNIAGHGVLDDHRRQTVGAEANILGRHVVHERD